MSQKPFLICTRAGNGENIDSIDSELFKLWIEYSNSQYYFLMYFFVHELLSIRRPQLSSEFIMFVLEFIKFILEFKKIVSLKSLF